MKKVLDYLNLRDIGLLELLLASTPMLSGFSLTGIPLMLLMWLIMIAVLIFRGKYKIRIFGPLLLFAGYWLIHEFVIMAVDNGYNFNSLIGQLIYYAGFFCLYSHLDSKKLRGAFNWISIIVIIGIVYQWADILRGNMVHPLDIPGLSMPEDRIDQEIPRPSSFFMEPSAFISFMVIPLSFSLIDKKYIWMAIMVLSVFLSTSTTGIVGVFIMLATSLFMQKKMNKSSIIILLLGAGFAFALFNSSFFELGVEKLLTTESGTNEHRLEQGMYIVSTMEPGEWLFGVPYSSPAHYCLSGRATNVAWYGSGADATVYMSTFWYVILRFGFVGLLIYLNIYLQVFRMSRKVWPLLIFMAANMFSAPDVIGVNYIVCLLVMLSLGAEDSRTEQVAKRL